MSDLFISYSRKDKEAARQLAEAFKARELEVWIDWEGIDPTVDWWKEVEQGIEGADNFLVLISPDSESSPVCKQELDHAVRNGKRLIPVVTRTTESKTVTPELRSLNWIYLRDEDDFEVGFETLVTALQTDYAWVHAHRQIQVKALEWERSGRKNDFLLQGEELHDAEVQLVANVSKDPHPTELQHEYVLKSRQVSDQRRRTIVLVSVGAAIVMTGLAIFGFVQAKLATDRANVALARQLATQGQIIIGI